MSLSEDVMELQQNPAVWMIPSILSLGGGEGINLFKVISFLFVFV